MCDLYPDQNLSGWPFRGVCVTPVRPLTDSESVWTSAPPLVRSLFLYLIIVHFSARINLSVTVILNG